jgi:hypothetical protein
LESQDDIPVDIPVEMLPDLKEKRILHAEFVFEMAKDYVLLPPPSPPPGAFCSRINYS